jgi:hypothetical protein
VPTSRTRELRQVAERIAASLPVVVEEVVLTGSVSRGVADAISDIEMLLVTTTRLDIRECFAHARRVGLVNLDTWGLRPAARPQSRYRTRGRLLRRFAGPLVHDWGHGPSATWLPQRSEHGLAGA